MAGEMQPRSRREWRPSAFTPDEVVHHAREQFEHSAANLRDRESLYKYGRPPLYKEMEDPYQLWGISEIEVKIADDLRLSGTEKILDIGCGDGSFLLWLEHSRRHQEEMIGIDPSISHAIDKLKNLELRRQRMQKMLTSSFLTKADTEKSQLTQFMHGDGEKLPDKWENRYDVVTILFVLYHTPHPMKVLEQAKKVLKPGGTLAVSIRGGFNLMRLWLFSNTGIAEELRHNPTYMGRYKNIKGPQSFYPQFDLHDTAEAIDRLNFSQIAEFIHSYPDHCLAIPRNGWEDYRKALLTLRPGFVTSPRGSAQQGPTLRRRDLNRAINNVIRPLFDKESREPILNPGGTPRVDEHGKPVTGFQEYLEQGYIVARNDK